MPARRRDPVSVPRTFHHSRPHHHDYGIDESISRAGYFSNAVLEDTDAAAAYSRAKDYDLLRNTHSAIRPSRPATRYQSLPPIDRRLSPSSISRTSLSPSRSALASSQSVSDLRKALQTPPPSSLLSTKINSFLGGYSLPSGVRPSTNSLVSYKSYLDSATPIRQLPSSRDNAMSVVSYKSHLSDPSVSSPFTTRSSSRLYRGFVPSSSSSLPSYRSRSNTSSSLPHYNISLNDAEDQEEDYDYGGGSDDYDDEEEYEPPSYRRKYKVLRAREALPSRPSSTLYYRTSSPAASDDEDDTYSVVSEGRGTYSYNPRPTGASSLLLSSFEGPHDGSYEADMADMYEYVPFGPSRQGILELTQHRPTSSIEIVDADNEDDEDDDDYNDVYSSSLPPSPHSQSTLLTIPSVRPSLISHIPSTTTTLYPTPSSDLTSYSPVSSFANNALFDSVLSSTAARARAALRDCENLSDYRNASLVMSVEGSAVTEDGKNRYGFKYYPPPIPIHGKGVGIDERILGVMPKTDSSPADSFLSGYLNRLKSLRSEIDDREKSRAVDSISHGRSVVPSVPRPLPSYAHSTIHMPVHISGRTHSVPVSSYRSHGDERGVSHRVDVFPLVENSASLGKDKIQLPLYRAGGNDTKLTMLEKINIKAATETHSTPRAAVASMKARASSVPPKVQGRPARLQQQLVNRPKVAPSIVYVSTPPPPPPPVASYNPSRYASKPVVPSEVPWRVRASSVEPRSIRAGSLPPRPLSYHPEPKQPLGTEGLRATRTPRSPVMLRSRAGSVPPQRKPQSFHSGEDLSPPRLIRSGSVQSLRPRSYHPVDNTAVRTEGLRAHKLPSFSRMNRAQSMNRLNPKPLDFGVDDEEIERSISKQARRAEEKKRPLKSFSSRATSEPPRFIAPSTNYPTISDVEQKSRQRQLFARRGQVGASMPSRSVLVQQPFVPSNAAKAAIIGSKMEASDGGKSKRKPRTLYHVEKSREPSVGNSQQSSIFYNNSHLESGGLQASRPPLPKQTDRKAIRTVDGFSKPKNVMSWEVLLSPRLPTAKYTSPTLRKGPRSRLRAYYRPLPPLVYVPPTKVSPPLKPLPRIGIRRIEPFRRAGSEPSSSTTSPVKIPDYYYAGTDPNNAPMSDLRRRLRRTLAKTKNN